MSLTQKIKENELSLICKNASDKCAFCVSYNQEKQVIQNLADRDLHVTSLSNALILSLKLARQYSRINGIWSCDHRTESKKGNLYVVIGLANLIKQNSRDVRHPESLIQGVFNMMENPKYRTLTEEFFNKIGKNFIKSLDPKDFELHRD